MNQDDIINERERRIRYYLRGHINGTRAHAEQDVGTLNDIQHEMEEEEREECR